MLQSKTNSGSTQNKGSISEQKEPTSDALLKLGKDSKLTPQECQCRMDNKLCLFCRTAGHITKDCAKAASSKPRAIKTEQENSESSALASKKD